MVEYLKVQRNKVNGQKFVNIPKGSMIKQGDYVKVLLVPDEIMEEQ